MLTLEQHAAMNPKEQCRDCHAVTTCHNQCYRCYAVICCDCAVTCAGCSDLNDKPMCAACAPRYGMERRGQKWYCENDPTEEESELEEARR